MANPETIEGSWGIDPVPSRLHVLSGLETGLLWGNLGVSLLVIVAGAILVPALSLPAPRRKRVLDHQLRSPGDAKDLIKSLNASGSP